MSKKVLFCGGGNMAEGVLRSVLKRSSGAGAGDGE